MLILIKLILTFINSESKPTLALLLKICKPAHMRANVIDSNQYTNILII